MRTLALPLQYPLSCAGSRLPPNPSSAAMSPFSDRRRLVSGSQRRAGKWVELGLGKRCEERVFGRVQAQKRPGNNTNEDTDEMFNDLFEKYGKVVYSGGDKKPPSAEADDDAESLAFAVALAKVADDVKAADIRVLFVKPLVYWTRFFIIVTAFSRPQIDAIGFRIRDTAEKQFRKVPTGDSKPNSWTLLDFGDVIVHIFLPEQRAFYNLEEFYGNATSIELPFDSQPPFRS